MRKIATMIISSMVILLTVNLSFAQTVPFGQTPPGFNRLAILYLFEKTPLSNAEPVGPWPIVPNGAWGSMSYNLWGPTFDFVFHGRRLVPNEHYTLIYYPDPWPGENLICLGTGIANKGGNLLIKGREDIDTSLPADYDANWTPCGEGAPADCRSGAVGAKIWLVPSSDVECNGKQIPDTDQSSPPQMVGWNPTEYLFEYNLINFQLQKNHGHGPVNKK
jgi:hypothetical protein